jgi:hypothetical protein
MTENVIVDYFANRQIEFPATIIIGTIRKNQSPNAMFHALSKVSFITIFLLLVFKEPIHLMFIAFQQNFGDFIQNFIGLVVQFREIEAFSFFLLQGGQDAKALRLSTLELSLNIGTILELKSTFPLSFIVEELSLVKISRFIKLSALTLSFALMEVA